MMVDRNIIAVGVLGGDANHGGNDCSWSQVMMVNDCGDCYGQRRL